MSCGTCRLCFGTKPAYQPPARKETKMSETTFATALDTLGQILPSDPGRDAIHLATYAVVAGERLFPGQHVGIIDGDQTQAFSTAEKLIGIVDPFLQAAVFPGQMFWLVLYPRTITSLRHVWEHPAFDTPAVTHGSGDVLADIGTTMSESEKWMRRWAAKHMSDDYYGDGPISSETAYQSAIEAGHDHNIGPYESARDHIDDEWWDHWETITGQKGLRGEYFRCAC